MEAAGGQAECQHLQRPDPGVRRRRGPRQGNRGSRRDGGRRGRPTTGTFNALIVAYNRRSRSAPRWRPPEVRPNAGTFNALIEACDNTGDPGKAIEV